MSSGLRCLDSASRALDSTSCQRFASMALCAAVKISPRAGLVVGAFCALTVTLPAARTADTRTERKIVLVMCDFSNWLALSGPSAGLYHNSTPVDVGGRAYCW